MNFKKLFKEADSKSLKARNNIYTMVDFFLEMNLKGLNDFLKEQLKEEDYQKLIDKNPNIESDAPVYSDFTRFNNELCRSLFFEEIAGELFFNDVLNMTKETELKYKEYFQNRFAFELDTELSPYVSDWDLEFSKDLKNKFYSILDI